MSAVSEASTEPEPVERDETTADCVCCVCCRDVPCLSTMDGGDCDLLPCLHVGS